LVKAHESIGFLLLRKLGELAWDVQSESLHV
jgi:hypothetical protein